MKLLLILYYFVLILMMTDEVKILKEEFPLYLDNGDVYDEFKLFI